MCRVIRREDVYVEMSTLILLRNGEKIPRKLALFWIMDCPNCKTAITDEEEVSFVKQAGTCFECTTGNVLDFCKRSICRTIHPERVAETKQWCERIAPVSSSFRLVHNYRSMRVEFHWSYDPAEAYLRIREQMLRIGKGLTTEEIQKTLDETIRSGVRGDRGCKSSELLSRS